MEPKLDPNRTKIEHGKEDAKRNYSKLSWVGPGEVLEESWNDLGPSWPNLRQSWDDLEAVGGAESLFFWFAANKDIFCNKMTCCFGNDEGWFDICKKKQFRRKSQNLLVLDSQFRQMCLNHHAGAQKMVPGIQRHSSPDSAEPPEMDSIRAEQAQGGPRRGAG